MVLILLPIVGNLEINLGRISISRKTITLLDTRRKSMVEQRKLRKSQLINHNQNNFDTSNFNTAQWLRDNQRPQADVYPNEISDQIKGGIDNRSFENDDGEIRMPPRQSRVTFS